MLAASISANTILRRIPAIHFMGGPASRLPKRGEKSKRFPKPMPELRFRHQLAIQINMIWRVISLLVRF